MQSTKDSNVNTFGFEQMVTRGKQLDFRIVYHQTTSMGKSTYLSI